MNLHRKPKPVTQAGRILKLLRDNEPWGTHNYELAKIALSYTKVISNLREDGYNIQCIRLGRSDHKYYLNEKVAK